MSRILHYDKEALQTVKDVLCNRDHVVHFTSRYHYRHHSLN